MPSGAEERAARRELTREAARRRAVTTLEVAGAIASYSARQIGNGLSPEAARQAALEVALELESVVLALRRLAGRPRPLDTGRRELAAELAAAGVPAAQVAARLGVHPSTVRKWRHRAAELPRATSSRPARSPTSATSFRNVKTPK